MSEISRDAWAEARREMAEMSSLFSNGHKAIRMDGEVYDFISDARGKGFPWHWIFQTLKKRSLTKYKMHESLQRAWRDEKRLREAE